VYNTLWKRRVFFMRQGWVKLHRKLLDNEFLRHDPTAKVVFITLLLIADRNGKGSFGRDLLGFLSGVKPTTAYKAFLRLKNANLVTQASNNRFTTFSICKWSEYQSSVTQDSNNEVTTKYQRSNNQVTHYKNKEVRIKNNIVEIQSIYDFYIKAFNKNSNSYKLTDKRKKKIAQRLKDSGAELLEQAISNTSRSPFHNGDNDRGWTADLDFIIRSYEQVERLAQQKDTNTLTVKDIKKEEMEYII